MSTPERLRITGGAVYDPANGVDGEVRDILIEGGRIVESLSDDAPRLDVSGMVVMPARGCSAAISSGAILRISRSTMRLSLPKDGAARNCRPGVRLRWIGSPG